MSRLRLLQTIGLFNSALPSSSTDQNLRDWLQARKVLENTREGFAETLDDWHSAHSRKVTAPAAGEASELS